MIYKKDKEEKEGTKKCLKKGQKTKQKRENSDMEEQPFETQR